MMPKKYLRSRLEYLQDLKHKEMSILIMIIKSNRTVGLTLLPHLIKEKLPVQEVEANLKPNCTEVK